MICLLYFVPIRGEESSSSRDRLGWRRAGPNGCWQGSEPLAGWGSV